MLIVKVTSSRFSFRFLSFIKLIFLRQKCSLTFSCRQDLCKVAQITVTLDHELLTTLLCADLVGN